MVGKHDNGLFRRLSRVEWILVVVAVAVWTLCIVVLAWR